MEIGRGEWIRTAGLLVTLIGRVRKDAKLFYLPAQQPATGRRCYGAPAKSAGFLISRNY